MSEHNFKKFTDDEAREIGKKIGIDWESSSFDVNQFSRGLTVEMEHGDHDPQTDVTGGDPHISGKIAWAHLKEFKDYYDRLEKMEEEAEREMGDA